jgi:prevent-host-death family protein
MSQTWQVQKAKADLSSLIRAAETNGPQTITRNGKPVAVVVAQSDFERLSRHEHRDGTLLEFFASWPDLSIPARDRDDTGRSIDL